MGAGIAEGATIHDLSITRTDGQPDNCGDPPDVPDPNNPARPDLFFPVNLPVPIPPNLPVPLPRIPLPPWLPVPFPPPSLPNPNDPNGSDPMTKSDGRKLEEQNKANSDKLDQILDQLKCIRKKICTNVGYRYIPMGTFKEAGVFLAPLQPYEKVVGMDCFVTNFGIVKTYRFSYDKYYKSYYPSLGEVGFVAETNAPQLGHPIRMQSQRIMCDFLEAKAFHYWFPIGVECRLTLIVQVTSGAE
jgi:hypothetical protein